MDLYRPYRLGSWVALEGTPYRRAFFVDHPFPNIEWYVNTTGHWFSREALPGSALIEHASMPRVPNIDVPSADAFHSVWGPWIHIQNSQYRTVRRLAGTIDETVYVADYLGNWYLVTIAGTERTLTPTTKPAWAPYTYPGHPMDVDVERMQQPDDVTFGGIRSIDGELYVDAFFKNDTQHYVVNQRKELYTYTPPRQLVRCFYPPYVPQAFEEHTTYPYYGPVCGDGEEQHRQVYECWGVKATPAWYLDTLGRWWTSTTGLWEDRVLTEPPYWSRWLAPWIPEDQLQMDCVRGEWFRRGQADYQQIQPSTTPYTGGPRFLMDSTGRFYTQGRRPSGGWALPKALKTPPVWHPGLHQTGLVSPLPTSYASQSAAQVMAWTSELYALLPKTTEAYATAYRYAFYDGKNRPRFASAAYDEVSYTLTPDDVIALLESGDEATSLAQHAVTLNYYESMYRDSFDQALDTSLSTGLDDYGMEVSTLTISVGNALEILKAAKTVEANVTRYGSVPIIIALQADAYAAAATTPYEDTFVLDYVQAKDPRVKIIKCSYLMTSSYIFAASPKIINIVRLQPPVSRYLGYSSEWAQHMFQIIGSIAVCVKDPVGVCKLLTP